MRSHKNLDFRLLSQLGRFWQLWANVLTRRQAVASLPNAVACASGPADAEVEGRCSEPAPLHAWQLLASVRDLNEHSLNK